MVLEVTITDEMNRTLYEKNKVYMPQSTDSLNNAMVYGPTHKLGIIRDTSIQPFAAKTETFEASMPEGIGKVRVNVELSYQPRPGDVYPIHHKTVELHLGKEGKP
ncbi:MAG: hypothetical protein QG552_2331 [Thermodesulfobacteriota bacterium]|nr:hypothetical protein [Thermodesulfobacteriota bacterium]